MVPGNGQRMDRGRLFTLWLLTVTLTLILLFVYLQYQKSSVNMVGKGFSLFLFNTLNAISCSTANSTVGNSPVGIIHVVLTFTKANAQLASKFNVAVSSMLLHTSSNIQLHIITDGASRGVAEKIMKDHEHTRSLVDVHYEYMEPLARQVSEKLGDILKFFRRNPTSYYGDNLFFISMILSDLSPFDSIDKVIMLDLDIKFRADISQLWQEFQNFRPDALIGIVHEQQPVYRHIFSAYRTKHRDTQIGEPPPDGITGFNSGVLLLDLAKMRTSAEYRSTLDIMTVEKLAQRYKFQGHLGDQDFYSLISTEYSHLFHVLSCGWNRQLCRYWQDKGYQSVFAFYHDCNQPVMIYHGNCNTPFPDD